MRSSSLVSEFLFHLQGLLVSNTYFFWSLHPYILSRRATFLKAMRDRFVDGMERQETSLGGEVVDRPTQIEVPQRPK